MKLNVYERMMLGMFLPQRGALEKATIAADIKKKAEFTQEEIAAYEVKTEGARTMWNAAGKEEKEFTFTKLEAQLLKDGLEDMNKKNEILAEMPFLDLCKKIKDEEVK